MGSIDDLQSKLAKRNILLVYENSYDWRAKGIEFHYFNDQFDSLNYYLEIYTLKGKIRGINFNISSNYLSPKRLNSKISDSILPSFKSSTRNNAPRHTALGFRASSLHNRKCPPRQHYPLRRLQSSP